jgi:hypothetical protein
LIEPVTHCGQPLPQAFALLLPNRILTTFIGEQGLFELHQNVIEDEDVAERDGQPISEFLFAESRQIALAPIAGATVIG